MLLLSLAACQSTSPKTPPIQDTQITDSEGTIDSKGTTDSSDTTDTSIPLFDCTPDFTALTAGIHTIDQGGSLPSLLIVHGDQACPIILDESNRTFVAAATYGQGHVLHTGHEGMVTDANSQGGDNAAFLLNVIRWAGQKDSPIVGTEGHLGVNDWLSQQGFEVREIDVSQLNTVDVWITTSYTERSDAEVQALQAWVEAGGGLVQGGHAWYWAYDHEDVAEQYPGNKILNPMGLTITEGTVSAGTDTVGSSPPSELYHASRALTAIQAHLDQSSPLSIEDQRQAAETVSTAVQYLPLSFSSYYDRIRDLLGIIPPVTPSLSAPITPARQPIEALLVTIQTRFAMDLPAEEVTDIDNEFPGMVTGGGETVQATLRADYVGRDSGYWYSDAGDPLWLGTGAYAVPGEVVQLSIPADWAGQGLSVQIGAHTDTLWDLETWDRYPAITRSWPLDLSTTTIASAFGGPIYIQVPAGVSLGEGSVTLENVLSYPHYIHGQTDPADFMAALNTTTVPLVEFESDRLILTLPTNDLASNIDPAALMDFWNTILDADADLAAIDHSRVRPERLAMDVQISAGWMHSGYPIMAYQYGYWLSDAAGLQSDGDWGAFHELGHNHQYGPTNLPGTTECTTNLWSVYDFETVLGIDRGVAHSALSPASRSQSIDDYLANGADFYADWNTWTCLETYLELQEAFGWDFYKNLNAYYLSLPANAQPSTDQARIDTWVVASSREAGMDLTPFYEAWGFPMSASVYSDVAGLPPWDTHPLVNR